MLLSKEDTFCEVQAPTNTANAVSVSTNVLDFGGHGDDVLHRLHLVVQCTGAASGATGALAIAWETCALENFASGSVTIPVTAAALAAADLTLGAYPVKNMPIPQGLLRYNRLKFTNGANTWSTAPKVSAYVVDGRQIPLG